MKKIGRLFKSRIFRILLIAFLIATALSIVLCFNEKLKISSTLYNVLFEINKALIVTVIFGAVIKLISNDMLKVKKNNDKLYKIGVEEITSGRTSNKHSDMLFGGKGHEYPKELKFLFISGNFFMKTFKERIVEAIKHGANVKILIADKDLSKDFLERAERLCKQEGADGSYANQIKITSDIVKEIIHETSNINGAGSIEVRHYKDEYRFNYRLGIYGEHSEITRGWVNYQSQLRDAIELSLGIFGEFNRYEDKAELSLFEDLDKSFDLLWDLYFNTSNKYLE